MYKIAELAKLSIPEKDKSRFEKDLSLILEMVEKIEELDVSGIQPLTHLSETENMVREDSPFNLDIKKQVLSNAPKHDGDYFKAPKFVEKS
ncbi:MAG: Asp-tRNA(Asn)/Glu-tRNA(Gln) amidotransferase subunit GatC [Bacteroidia bacterium]|nr:Asp-tRNA(Asn)/Glu-tRNA(Gln) amidotransferase subunit GatC [Bacteroidia bacterium]MDW8334163.1 Asp-tRNA(Asn)/Glu-tRNA(Gln) amidotransferase subunit GatC [Bacteroidia bacterium]